MKRMLMITVVVMLMAFLGDRQMVRSQTDYANVEQLIKLIQATQKQVYQMLSTIGKAQSSIDGMGPSTEPGQLFVKLAELRSKEAEVMCNRINMSLDQALNILDDPRRYEQAHLFFESAQTQFEQVFLLHEESQTLIKLSDWFEDHPSTR